MKDNTNQPIKLIRARPKVFLPQRRGPTREQRTQERRPQHQKGYLGMTGNPLILHPGWLDNGHAGQTFAFLTTLSSENGPNTTNVLRAIEACGYFLRGTQIAVGILYKSRQAKERIGLVESHGENPQELLDMLRSGIRGTPPIEIRRIGKDSDIYADLSTFIDVAKLELPEEDYLAEGESRRRVVWTKERISASSAPRVYTPARRIIDFYKRIRDQ